MNKDGIAQQLQNAIDSQVGEEELIKLCENINSNPLQ